MFLFIFFRPAIQKISYVHDCRRINTFIRIKKNQKKSNRNDFSNLLVAAKDYENGSNGVAHGQRNTALGTWTSTRHRETRIAQKQFKVLRSKNPCGVGKMCGSAPAVSTWNVLRRSAKRYGTKSVPIVVVATRGRGGEVYVDFSARQFFSRCGHVVGTMHVGNQSNHGALARNHCNVRGERFVKTLNDTSLFVFFARGDDAREPPTSTYVERIWTSRVRGNTLQRAKVFRKHTELRKNRFPATFESYAGVGSVRRARTPRSLLSFFFFFFFSPKRHSTTCVEGIALLRIITVTTLPRRRVCTYAVSPRALTACYCFHRVVHYAYSSKPRALRRDDFPPLIQIVAPLT